MFCSILKIVQMCKPLCKMFFSFDLQAIGHFGVWWDTLVRCISCWDGRKSGGSFPQRGPHILFSCHLSGLMVGYLGGGQVVGWLGEGRGDHVPCVHSLHPSFYPNLSNSGGVPCADLGKSPWGSSNGGNHGVVYGICVANWPHGSNT